MPEVKTSPHRVEIRQCLEYFIIDRRDGFSDRTGLVDVVMIPEVSLETL